MKGADFPSPTVISINNGSMVLITCQVWNVYHAELDSFLLLDQTNVPNAQIKVNTLQKVTTLVVAVTVIKLLRVKSDKISIFKNLISE